MATFITRTAAGTGGVRLAVKDLIDVEGVPTTAGSRVVAGSAGPAAADAACMAGARAAGAAVVGKTNLVELAYGASGINDHFGTPVNPLDPALLPGGSSSGSAVAVATGEADVAYGSDTGGSIRVPAAYCGVAGLKTTHGRVPLAGVWPLSPSLDTVGPMARDVAGLVTGMQLLEPGFAVAASPAVAVGRLRPAGIRVDPAIDTAIDAALRQAGLAVTEVELPGWRDALRATYAILDREAAACNARLLADPDDRAGLGAQVRDRLTAAATVTSEQEQWGRGFQRAWKAELGQLLRAVQVLVTPATPMFAPPVAEGSGHHHTRCTAPVNLAGLPALAIPVPAGRLPASMQLIGPPGSEELLLATGAVIEAAARG
ncbi:MAG: amidase [Streptosporangiaceae bacterium]